MGRNSDLDANASSSAIAANFTAAIPRRRALRTRTDTREQRVGAEVIFATIQSKDETVIR
jgi:hypothetical protein